MKNMYVVFALGPTVLTALYLAGSKLFEDIKIHRQLRHFNELMSITGWLLNDIWGFKGSNINFSCANSLPNALRGREIECRVIKSLIHDPHAFEEEGVNESKSLACGKGRELLRLVLQDKDSEVPGACKDSLWTMNRVLNLFYARDDGFTSEEMINVVKRVI